MPGYYFIFLLLSLSWENSLKKKSLSILGVSLSIIEVHMSFIDKQGAAIIREFVNKTKPLTLIELTDFFNNEEYLKIQDFNKEDHLDLLFDVVLDSQGIDLKSLLVNDCEQFNEPNNKLYNENEITHSIALIFTEPSLQMVSPKIIRIPFSFGKPVSDVIDDYLFSNDLDNSIYQNNGAIESIVKGKHLIDHLFYVFIDDLKDLESFLSLTKISSVDKYIWLNHISKLFVLSFDKKQLDALNKKRKKIEDIRN